MFAEAGARDPPPQADSAISTIEIVRTAQV
jgi:hypothetical protein